MAGVASGIALSHSATSLTRWRVLAGAVVVQLILGTVYGYSIFWEPLQADVFPMVMTQVQHDSAVAAGGDVGSVLVVWFPDHKGLVSGIAVAGFGFGAYLFKGRGIGALGYIQEHRIAEFFLVHGMVCFVAVTLGALLLCNPPSAQTAPQSGRRVELEGDATPAGILRPVADVLRWRPGGPYGQWNRQGLRG